jgi:hypothetical protein
MNLKTLLTGFQPTSPGGQSITHMHEACEELGSSIDKGNIGEIVAKHETLILHYYQDVLDQAKKSFGAATFVAWIGFWVLIVTSVYVLIFDAPSQISLAPSISV